MNVHIVFRSQLFADGRGKKSTPKYSDQDVISHIESYRPTLAHYRPKHTLVRRYLPAEITVKSMCQDFKGMPVRCLTAALTEYRIKKHEHLHDPTLLRLEECEVCQYHDLHKKNCTCEAVCDVSKYTMHNKALHKRQKEIPARLKIHSCLS
ncbi:hypothetical protein RRG08_039410 [Elysia crispata]|uniref:Uncharacterized protein n=1 Tax=Elysia crispata TaxID=231223 RepID=A0AAE1DVE9_9GAST|nr:hypothetical protein RRG08_039410 [Elysia crispata]